MNLFKGPDLVLKLEANFVWMSGHGALKGASNGSPRSLMNTELSGHSYKSYSPTAIIPLK